MIHAVRQPLEKVNPGHEFDFWEGVLYTMALAFSLEGASTISRNSPCLVAITSRDP